MAVRKYATVKYKVLTEPPWEELTVKRNSPPWEELTAEEYKIAYANMSVARLFVIIRQKADLPTHTPIELEGLEGVSGRADLGKALTHT